ncbi:putative zinc metalloprotease chloroplastic isoform X1 [Micractinium conductrix]|uniref:Zinc metalloprotease chloroplastic isoform X1 n=1 Tax=Micractinium conductrix TaxID=554055 RepID=A0A2P6V275_9CHLO|nr:putative zinc metalloprotease chloroplastic isoform X1 [Micractinium conductrix]|eukprot:PSC68193.1 putative zinc metalloprotease chloroplastic isoform X1 [Micractinium conductrix]
MLVATIHQHASLTARCLSLPAHRVQPRGARRNLWSPVRAQQQPGDGSGSGEDVPPPPAAEQPPPSAPAVATEEPPAAEDANLQLPPEVIQRLRTTVFGFDTFFVTGVENYQADGVLFRGNLRGEPAAAYAKLTARLQAELGEQYKLYLLENREELPVAVVLPLASVLPQLGPLPEQLLAAGLGLASVATTLNIFGADLFNAALLTANWDAAAVAAAAPGAAAFVGILGVHELAHAVVAKQRGLQLAPPIFIPAGLGLLGSFGAVTRFKSFVPTRADLAAVAAAGPLASSAVAAAVMLAGAALSAQGVGGIELAVDSFKESLLAGALGQAVFGDQLFTMEAVDTNPLFVAGWAGLIINAINCLPVGELDGGRTFLGLCGRRAAARVGAVTLLLLGLAGFSNSLSLFWLILVVTLQRGPILPCDQELSSIEDAGTKYAAIAALVLPLLVLLPYPAVLSITNGLPDLPPTF